MQPTKITLGLARSPWFTRSCSGAASVRTHTRPPPALLNEALADHRLPPTGIAARLWQLGIEMRPLFNKESLWVYPVYAGIGGSFGYWLMGVEHRQYQYLAGRRDTLLEKRARRKEREEASAEQS